MKQKFLLAPLLVIFCFFNSSAQHSHLGAQLSGAASKLTVNNSNMNPQWGLSFQLGAYYLYRSTDRSMFGVELLLNNVRGAENREGHNADNRPVKLETERVYRYLSLPAFVGYELTDKWSINLGLQYSRLFFARINTETRTLNQYNEWVLQQEKNEPDWKSWNLGPRAGILWQITSHIGVEATYYHSLWNKTEAVYGVPEWQISQFALGVRVGG